MDRQIPERDWKQWRKVSASALEAFCRRILEESAAFARGPGTAHSRYLDLFRYLRERDEQIGTIFDNQRRSTAYRQIAAAISTGVVARETLSSFSDETRAVIERLLELT